MPRISGVDIPNDKRIIIALTYVYGIGRTRSGEILEKAKVDINTRAKDLTEEQVSVINKAIRESETPVEGELSRIVAQNIRRLKEIKSYRGMRHRLGLPVKGQRTRSNARTRKGKRKTMGGIKKKAAK
jgi:small subunit ribosomal protein S13